MTDTDLRDLFQAAAPDLDRHDPAAVDRAWRDGCQRRTRARVAIASSIAATAAAVIGVAIFDRPVGQLTPAPAPGSSPATEPARLEESGPTHSGPDATYDGAPVWVSPSTQDRADLPSFEDTRLPVEIDVSADASPTGTMDRAVAVLAMMGSRGELHRVVAIAADGGTHSVDTTSKVEPVTDGGGNAMSPLSGEGLSPDGTHVFFRQEHALVVHDLRTATWAEIPTPRWTAETAQWMDGGIFVPREPWGSTGTVYSLDGTRVTGRTLRATEWDGGEEYGPERPTLTGETAQSYFVTSDADRDEWSFAGVNAVVVSGEGRPRILVHDMDEPGGKMCCPVAGWLDPGVVAFQSGSDLLAWKVPGGGLSRVTRITGLEPDEEWYVASWAFSPRAE
jgi:hypothetical protein